MHRKQGGRVKGWINTRNRPYRDNKTYIHVRDRRKEKECGIEEIGKKRNRRKEGRF